jgi:ribose transport system ATP-binding protein
VGQLSPAEKTGVAVARALGSTDGDQVSLLVLDEPTAALPHDDVDQLLETMRTVSTHRVAVIFVTHRLEEVLRVADEVTVLRDGSRVASRAVSGLDRPQLVEMLVGSELEDAHSVSQELTDAMTRLSSRRMVLPADR